MDFTLDELNIVEDTPKQKTSNGIATDFDPYKVLEVSQNATQIEIREAYIRMKSAFQSNSQSTYSIMGPEESQQILNDMSRAYDILTGAISPSVVSNRVASGNLQPATKAESVNQAKPIADNLQRPILRAKATNVEQEEIKRKLQAILSADNDNKGEVLINLRETAGLTLQDVSNHTKLSEGMIREIEDESFESLPAAVYVRGYMKSFFKFIALGEQRAFIDRYVERMNSAKR